MNGEFLEALQQIAKEKDIPLETLIETVESALATAYKRNNAANGEIKVRIDSNKAVRGARASAARDRSPMEETGAGT